MKKQKLFVVVTALAALLSACGGGSNSGGNTSESASSAAPVPVYGKLSGVYDGALKAPSAVYNGKLVEGGLIEQGVIEIVGAQGYRTATAYADMVGNHYIGGGSAPCYRLAELDLGDTNGVFNTTDAQGNIVGTLLKEEPSTTGTPKVHAYFAGEKDGFTWNFSADGYTLVSADYAGKHVNYSDTEGNRELYVKNDRLTLNVGYREYNKSVALPKDSAALKKEMCSDVRVHPKYLGNANYVGFYDVSFNGAIKTPNTIGEKRGDLGFKGIVAYMSIDKDGIVRVYEQTGGVGACFSVGKDKHVNLNMDGARLTYDPTTRSLYTVIRDIKYSWWLDEKGFIYAVGPDKDSFHSTFDPLVDEVISSIPADVTLDYVRSQLCPVDADTFGVGGYQAYLDGLLKL